MLSAQTFVSLAAILALLPALLTAVAYAVMMERKVAAWAQDRIGPNRVGFEFGQWFMPKFHFWGLGQPAADGIKLLIKEDYTPPGVDKGLFILAPAMALIPALIAWAVIPWGGYWDFPGLTVMGYEIAQPGPALVAAAPVNIGILFILAVGSLAVYGVVVGGYASNNKYSFLGGLRATAQMLSYEIPMALCVLMVILAHASIRVDQIAYAQASGLLNWNLIYMPLVAVIFFTCQLAEANRTPFDLAECEQELVAGFHTEYSSMKFALYFLSEYMHVITGAAVFTLLFLGAWDIPFIAEPALGATWLIPLRIGVFAGKVFLMVFLVMMIRWTIPRFRFDQLMKLAWRSLIPVTIILLLLSAIIRYLEPAGQMWWLLAANVATFVGWVVIEPRLPKGPPINRRVALAGSRFSAPPAGEAG